MDLDRIDWQTMKKSEKESQQPLQNDPNIYLYVIIALGMLIFAMASCAHSGPIEPARDYFEAGCIHK